MCWWSDWSILSSGLKGQILEFLIKYITFIWFYRCLHAETITLGTQTSNRSSCTKSRDNSEAKRTFGLTWSMSWWVSRFSHGIKLLYFTFNSKFIFQVSKALQSSSCRTFCWMPSWPLRISRFGGWWCLHGLSSQSSTFGPMPSNFQVSWTECQKIWPPPPRQK